MAPHHRIAVPTHKKKCNMSNCISHFYAHNVFCKWLRITASHIDTHTIVKKSVILAAIRAYGAKNHEMTLGYHGVTMGYHWLILGACILLLRETISKW